MADIKAELKTYLKTVSGVTDLVGAGSNARIFVSRPRQGTTKPFIIIASTGARSHEHLGGITGMATTAVHVWACGANPAAADALAEEIRLAPLQGFRGFLNNTKATVSAQTHRDDGYETPDDGSDSALYYWTRRVFLITHTEPTA